MKPLPRKWWVTACLAVAAFGGGVASEIVAERRPGYAPMARDVEAERSRLEITGAVASKAGLASLALDAELLRLRQDCRGICDQLTIDFSTPGEGVFVVRGRGAGGDVFREQAYFDSPATYRLAIGSDGRLMLQPDLRGY